MQVLCLEASYKYCRKTMRFVGVMLLGLYKARSVGNK
jgi:hypothetical protein